MKCNLIKTSILFANQNKSSIKDYYFDVIIDDRSESYKLTTSGLISEENIFVQRLKFGFPFSINEISEAQQKNYKNSDLIESITDCEIHQPEYKMVVESYKRIVEKNLLIFI
jgi:hypothetical protein